jgi:nitroreductase
MSSDEDRGLEVCLKTRDCQCYVALQRRIAYCASRAAGLRTYTFSMSTLTKFALGVMGQLRPRPARGDARRTIKLPPPDKRGGLPLMQALARRRSSREFQRKPLPLPVLSNLLGAAFGVNRRGGGRTAPSAINAQEIDVYVALPDGAYLYDARAHCLRLVAGSDLRRVTGYQDFVDDAPLDLVYVADHSRMRMIPVKQRESYASAAAGAIAQNVYLYAASAGLATVIRAWIDRAAIANALGLTHDQQVLLSQTAGYPRP